mgnify:FL=1
MDVAVLKILKMQSKKKNCVTLGNRQRSYFSQTNSRLFMSMVFVDAPQRERIPS